MSFVSKILTIVLLIAVPLARAAVFPLKNSALTVYEKALNLIYIDTTSTVKVTVVKTGEGGASLVDADIITAIKSITYINDDKQKVLIANKSPNDLTAIELRKEINRLLALKKEADTNLNKYVGKLADIRTFLFKGTNVGVNWDSNMKTYLNLNGNHNGATADQLKPLKGLDKIVDDFKIESVKNTFLGFEAALEKAKELLNSEEKWKIFYKNCGIVYPIPTDVNFPETFKKESESEYERFKTAFEAVVNEANKVFLPDEVKAKLTTVVENLGPLFTSTKPADVLKTCGGGAYKAKQDKLYALIASPGGSYFKLKELVDGATSGTADWKADMKKLLDEIKLVVDDAFVLDDAPKTTKLKELVVVDDLLLVKMDYYYKINSHLKDILTKAIVTDGFKFSAPVIGTSKTDIEVKASAIFTLLPTEISSEYTGLKNSAENVVKMFGSWRSDDTDKDNYNAYRKSVRNLIKTVNEFFAITPDDVFGKISERIDASKVEDLQFEMDKFSKEIVTEYNPVIKKISELTLATVPPLTVPVALSSLSLTYPTSSKITISPGTADLELKRSLEKQVKGLTDAVNGFIASSNETKLLLVRYAAHVFVKECTDLINGIYSSETTLVTNTAQNKFVVVPTFISHFHSFLVNKSNVIVDMLDGLTVSTDIATKIPDIKRDLDVIIASLGLNIGLPTVLTDLVKSGGSLLVARSLLDTNPLTMSDVFKFKEKFSKIFTAAICHDSLKLLDPALVVIALKAQTKTFGSLVDEEMKKIIGLTNLLTTQVGGYTITSTLLSTALDAPVSNLIDATKASTSNFPTLKACDGSYTTQTTSFEGLEADKITDLKGKFTTFQSNPTAKGLSDLKAAQNELVKTVKDIITGVYKVNTVVSLTLKTTTDFILNVIAPDTNSAITPTPETIYNSYKAHFDKLNTSALKIPAKGIVSIQLKEDLLESLNPLSTLDLKHVSFMKSGTNVDVNLFNNVNLLKDQIIQIIAILNGTTAVANNSTQGEELIRLLNIFGPDAKTKWKALLDASDGGDNLPVLVFTTITGVAAETSAEMTDAVKKTRIGGIFESSNALLNAAKDLGTGPAPNLSAQIAGLRNLVETLAGEAGLASITTLKAKSKSIIDALNALGIPNGLAVDNVIKIPSLVEQLALAVLNSSSLLNDITPALIKEILPKGIPSEVTLQDFDEKKLEENFKAVSGKLDNLIKDITGILNAETKIKIQEIVVSIEGDCVLSKIYPFGNDPTGIKSKLTALLTNFTTVVAPKLKELVIPVTNEEEFKTLKSSLSEFMKKWNELTKSEIGTTLLDPEKPKTPEGTDNTDKADKAAKADSAEKNENPEFTMAMSVLTDNFTKIANEVDQIDETSTNAQIEALVARINALKETVTKGNLNCTDKDVSILTGFKVDLDNWNKILEKVKAAPEGQKAAAITELKAATTTVRERLESFKTNLSRALGVGTASSMGAMTITFIVGGSCMLVMVCIGATVFILRKRNDKVPKSAV